MKKDTICAISTPSGSGGISIVRMSGNNAIDIADKLFLSKNNKPSSFSSREMKLGNFYADGFQENCMCVVFRSPNSFTGENLVEFQIHGGAYLAKKILQVCSNSGARLAKNGEFSKRAFENGKTSLDKLEGMMDMINAESEAELKAGQNLYKGVLSKKTNKLQKEIIDILSEIEVSFDYPEEDIEEVTIPKIEKKLKIFSNAIDEILKDSKTGSQIKNGINVLIVGKPNVGKSSLLNRLLKKEKAIVTDIAGTTRDIIEDNIMVNGIKINLVDTAGIHETEDLIEKIGIKKTKDLTKNADIILFVFDASRPYDKSDDQIYNLIKDKNHITILNKTDKKQFTPTINEQWLEISAKSGKNIEKIANEIYSKTISGNFDEQSSVMLNERHIQLLQDAKRSITDTQSAIKTKQTLDIVSIPLKKAYKTLGEITGNTANESIINRIFEKFCVGK